MEPKPSRRGLSRRGFLQLSALIAASGGGVYAGLDRLWANFQSTPLSPVWTRTEEYDLETTYGVDLVNLSRPVSANELAYAASTLEELQALTPISIAFLEHYGLSILPWDLKNIILLKSVLRRLPSSFTTAVKGPVTFCPVSNFKKIAACLCEHFPEMNTGEIPDHPVIFVEKPALDYASPKEEINGQQVIVHELSHNRINKANVVRSVQPFLTNNLVAGALGAIGINPTNIDLAFPISQLIDIFQSAADPTRIRPATLDRYTATRLYYGALVPNEFLSVASENYFAGADHFHTAYRPFLKESNTIKFYNYVNDIVFEGAIA